MKRIATRLLVGAAAVLVANQGASAAPTGSMISITVHEGTSLAIALSPDKSLIALDLQGGLWVMSRNGGVARRITDEYGDIREPAWSPDGRQIAYQSYRDGGWHIWTIDADGSNARQITTGPFDDREPFWSPDGASLVFSSDRSGNYDLWTLNLASGALRQVTSDPGEDFFPTWSPDGRKIAFVSTRPAAPGVYTVTLDGREALVAGTKGNVGSPSWSPDGKLLHSVIEGGKSTLMLDGTPIARGEDYFPFRAQWLSEEAFLYPADGRIKMRSLGSDTTDLIDFSATLSLLKPSYVRKARDFDTTAPRPAKGIVRPTLSPDGNSLSFAALGDIWRMPLGGAPARITDDEFVDSDPAWSPDGKRIAYASDRAGSMDIWVRDLVTGADMRITSGSEAEMAPAWSPDGKSIAYVSNINMDEANVYVVPALGGEPRKLTPERLFSVGYPGWTPDGAAVITSGFFRYSQRYREGVNYYNVLPLDGSGPVLQVPTAHVSMGKRLSDGPALSPDGKFLAYASNGTLFALPVDSAARASGPAMKLSDDLADQVSWAGPDHILYTNIDRIKLLSLRDRSVRDIPVDLKWSRKLPSGTFVIHAGRLIDGVHPTARTDMDIVIDRNRIVAVEPHRAALHVGTVVDASNQSVMPGLVEGHGHPFKEFGSLFGRANLAYGITSFRSLASEPYEGLEDKEAIESGRRPGPRIFSTGYLIDGRRPYPYALSSTMTGPDTIDKEIERARRLDFDMLKTYVRLPDDLQRRAIEGAHRIGIPTSSHEIYPAALSGSDNVEHSGATSRRGYSTKQSLMGRAYDDVIQIIAKSGMGFTPTLALGGYGAAVAADPSLQQDRRFLALQPEWKKTIPILRETGSRPAAWNTVMKVARAGGSIIAGVDSPLVPYGLGIHIELQNLVAAGMTPYQALRTATIVPLTYMGAGSDLGTVEKGKLADLVIIDGNPLSNIKDTMNVRKVLKNGAIFEPRKLIIFP